MDGFGSIRLTRATVRPTLRRYLGRRLKMRDIYKGYEVDCEFEAGEFLVYKHGKIVHRAASRPAAHKWIDKEQKR